MSLDGVCFEDFSVQMFTQSPAQFKAEPSTGVKRATPRQDEVLQRNEQMLKAAKAAIVDAYKSGSKIAEAVEVNLQRFLRLLPAKLPVAEVSVTAAGSICFDWGEDADCQLSVALQAGSRIVFAAYFSGDTLHGSSAFSAVELPEEIIAAISKLLKHHRRA